MTNTLYVGTRKGLFAFSSTAGSAWECRCLGFLGDPVSAVLPDPRDGSLYAALDLGHFGVKLHRSRDAGQTWTEIAHPQFVGEKRHTPETFGQPLDYDGPTVDAIWWLEPADPRTPGTLWAGVIPTALFYSADAGATWTLNQPYWDLFQPQGKIGPPPKGKPTLHSILVDPRDHRRLMLGASGGVWLSDDGGATWRVGGPGMYMEPLPPEIAHLPEMQDAHRIVQCPAAPDVVWCQHHNGVFRSTNRAANWEDIKSAAPSKFGFAVAVHPRDPLTAWFVPGVKDECRVPVGAQVVVSRTRDGGRTFEVLRQGLPQQHAYDLVYRHGLDIDATGDCLAFGSTTGNLWLTTNQGDSWQHLAGHLPPINCVRFG